VQVNKHLDQLECDKLLKLYIDVYAHAPTNKNYLAIFLCGWLAKCKEFSINWAQYAYDTTQEQMKRSKRPSFSSKRNCSTTLDSKQMSQFERGLELNDIEDYIMLDELRKLNVFLSNQIVVMKELVEATKIFKQSTRPKRSFL
jgi:hypothetical protein